MPKEKSTKKGKNVVPLRKEGLLRPQEDEPFAGFGFDLDEGAMIIRNPDGTIERESLIDDDGAERTTPGAVRRFPT